MSVTHRRVVVAADDGTSEVGSNEWNDDHSIILDGVLPGYRRGATADRYYVAGMAGGGALVAGVRLGDEHAARVPVHPGARLHGRPDHRERDHGRHERPHGHL
jgi:hypothetical protein